ncbi:prominin-2 isoform X2 [Brachyhypopomus gauderio]
MSSIVHSFLQSVQPHPFPKELVVSVIENTRTITQEETIKKVLTYETGLLVCVAIGIIYIILVPLIGLCFACCRCCGNCGGRMYQKQTSNTQCKRRTFYWVTVLITVFMLAGNVCMFLSNSYTGEIVRASSGDVNNILENLQSYFNTVPKQIDQVINESSVTVDNISQDINDTGHLLGTEIKKHLEGPFQMTLGPVWLLEQLINITDTLLRRLNKTQPELQSNLTVLQGKLSNVTQKLSNSSCQDNHFSLNCSVDLNLTLSNLSELSSCVVQARKIDLNKQIKEGQEYLESIPQRVTNETRDRVQGIMMQLQGIKTDISKLTNKVPLNILSDISDVLGNAQRNISTYTPYINKGEQIRGIVAVILCCLILLVVVCNFLGLLLGPAGLKSNVSPSERSSTANCGGVCLMAGVGFSFLFSWVFMIVVVILFIVGANTYTLICVPWQTGQLFQVIDTPAAFQVSQLSQLNVSVSDIYNDCHHNKSLWITLHLGNIIDLGDILNVSKFTVNVHDEFEDMIITFPNITLLSPEIQSQLRNVSSTASSVNVTSIIQEINAISKQNLNVTADELDDLANNQPNDTIKASLQKDANYLRSLQTWIEAIINPLVCELNSTINNISVIASRINGTVENVLEAFSYAQSFFNDNTTEIVKSKTRRFVNCHIEFITTFAEWANKTITDQVGACGPVASAVDEINQLICTQLVESLNAFWFSLGWCLIFLIPSIIFSVKLAKHYRRMKHTDLNENLIMMNPVPRANIKM